MLDQKKTELLGWWPFNNSFANKTANRIHLAISAAVKFTHSQKGVIFKQGGYLAIPPLNNLLDQIFTVEAWVKPTGSSSNDDEFEEDRSGRAYLYAIAVTYLGLGDDLGLWWEAKNNRFVFGIETRASQNSVLSDKILFSDKVPRDSYHHVVAIYDTEGMRLYLNGKLTAHNVNLPKISYDKHPWFIGGMPPEYSGFIKTWRGEIGTIRFYRGAMHTEKVEQLYDACKSNIWTDEKLFMHLLETKPHPAIATVPLDDALLKRIANNDTNLLAIDLYARDIGDIGAKKLAEALKNNTTIIYIDLGDNNIHDEGAGYLVEAFNENTSITWINLGIKKNPIAEFFQKNEKKIEQYLKFLTQPEFGFIALMALACRAGYKLGAELGEALKPYIKRPQGSNPIGDKKRKEIFKLLACNLDYQVLALPNDNKEDKQGPSKLEIIPIAEKLKSLQSEQQKALEALQLTPLPNQKSVKGVIPQEGNTVQLTDEEQENINGYIAAFRQKLEVLTTPVRQQATLDQQFQQYRDELKPIITELAVSRTQWQEQQKVIEKLTQKLAQKKDSLASKELQILKQKIQPLLEGQAQLEEQVEQQEWILGSDKTNLFYNYMRTKLSQVFLMWMAGDQNPDNTNRAIYIFGKVLDIFTLGLGSLLTDGINAIHDQRRAQAIAPALGNIPNISAAQSLAERIARNLTLRCAFQIKIYSLPEKERWWSKLLGSAGPRGGVQTLADSAIRHTLEGLISFAASGQKRIDPIDLHQKLIEFILTSQAKLGFLGLTNIKIDVKPTKTDPHPRRHTDQGTFLRSGRGTKEAGFARAIIDKPGKYGYLWGTKDEAEKLGKLPVTGYSPDSTTMPPQSFFNQLNKVPKASSYNQQPTTESDEKANYDTESFTV